MTIPVAPRPGATVMLLRDGDPGLEVLMLRRSDRASFVPGAHVFPGGVVDDDDHDPRYQQHWISDEPVDDLPYRVAAVRECLEEAGVLLAIGARDGAPPDRDHPLLADVATLRGDVERGTVDLAQTVAAHRFRLAVTELSYVARWITPEESPRRYDTRFYVAAMPAGQDAVADDREVAQAGWWSPGGALDAWTSGTIHLIEPTVASLDLLSEFARADAACRELRQRTPEGAR